MKNSSIESDTIFSEASNQSLKSLPNLDNGINNNPENLQNMTGLDEKRLYAAMSYMAFLVFVPLLTRRKDPFINFHAKQGLGILVGYVLAAIAANWISAIGSLIFITLLVFDIIALVFTLQGRSWRIPGIGHLAEKVRL